jgi:hypothetical protein
MKKIILIMTTLFVLLGGLLAVRFLFGGDEDSWICSGGQWVKHGNPRSPVPTKICPQ